MLLSLPTNYGLHGLPADQQHGQPPLRVVCELSSATGLGWRDSPAPAAEELREGCPASNHTAALEPPSPGLTRSPSPQSPADGVTSESTAGEVTSESTAGEVTSESTAGEVTSESTAGEVTSESMAGGVTSESTTGEVMSESAADEVTSESPPDEAPSEPAADEALAEMSHGTQLSDSLSRGSSSEELDAILGSTLSGWVQSPEVMSDFAHDRSTARSEMGFAAASQPAESTASAESTRTSESTASTKSTETWSEWSGANDGDAGGLKAAGGADEVRASRQRYEKLFHYFQTLNAAEGCPLAAARRLPPDTAGSPRQASPERREPPTPDGGHGAPLGASESTAGRAASDDGDGGDPGGDAANSEGQETSPGCQFALTGIADYVTSECSGDVEEGCGTSEPGVPAVGSCATDEPSESSEACRGERHAGALVEHTRCRTPSCPSTEESFAVARCTTPPKGIAPKDCAEARTPIWKRWRRERTGQQESPRQTAVSAWHQEYDELMRPCRGDGALPPPGGPRRRSATPSREQLRHLREQVCIGCSRAFPESNYFDIYYHVNTVFKWFNWKWEA